MFSNFVSTKHCLNMSNISEVLKQYTGISKKVFQG